MVSYDHLATACLEHDTLDDLSAIQTPSRHGRTVRPDLLHDGAELDV